MFGIIRGNIQDGIGESYRREYGESIESNEEDDSLNYHICIEVKDDNEYHVDNCKENWDILTSLDNETSCFIYLKDSVLCKNGIFGIRVSEIVAFYLEED